MQNLKVVVSKTEIQGKQLIPEQHWSDLFQMVKL